MKPILRLFATVGVVVQFAMGAAANDRIETRDGKPIEGSIQKESATEVLIETSGGAHSVPVNRIRYIHYNGQAASLTFAKTQEDAYNLRRAAEEYAKAQAVLKDKPRILQAAQFGEARALARLALDESAGVDEAIARLQKFASDNADSRHYFPVLELLGRLHFEKKDYALAAGVFNELGKAPWPEAKMQAVVYVARLLRARNNLVGALAALEPILTDKTDSPEQQQLQGEALLEKANCLRALDRRDAEIETLEQVIDRVGTSAGSLQGEAYAALGDAYRAIRKPKEALLAYLHVELLFAKHRELHARALYNLSQLWNELGQPDRSAAAQSTLKTEHPNSSWTKRLGSS
jgi:tetratricopeptide (TPR) repeat protein